MKKLILTMGFAALTAIGFGQELHMDKVDEFTGKSIKMTKSYKVGKRGSNTLYMSVRRVDDFHGIEFWSTSDQGCAGAVGNYVIFLNSAGESVKLDDDIVDIDCADNASSIYVLDTNQFSSFVISKIRFTQSDSYDDFEYSGEYTISQLIQSVQ